jgi:hypothetical protein
MGMNVGEAEDRPGLAWEEGLIGGCSVFFTFGWGLGQEGPDFGRCLSMKSWKG